MLTPLRCITNLTKGLVTRLHSHIAEDEQIGTELDLIDKTTQLLLNQVKGNLDRDMIS